MHIALITEIKVYIYLWDYCNSYYDVPCYELLCVQSNPVVCLWFIEHVALHLYRICVQVYACVCVCTCACIQCVCSLWAHVFMKCVVASAG